MQRIQNSLRAIPPFFQRAQGDQATNVQVVVGMQTFNSFERNQMGRAIQSILVVGQQVRATSDEIDLPTMALQERDCLFEGLRTVIVEGNIYKNNSFLGMSYVCET